MTEAPNPLERYLSLENQLTVYQFGMISRRRIEGLNNNRAWKDRELAKISDQFDMGIENRIGTLDLFNELTDVAWGVFKATLPTREQLEGEGKVQLLRNIMNIGEETRLPTPDELLHWADDISLPHPMLESLFLAAGHLDFTLTDERFSQRSINYIKDGFKDMPGPGVSGYLMLGAGLAYFVAREVIRNLFRRNRSE